MALEHLGKVTSITLLLSVVLSACAESGTRRYTPDWESLDGRPLPSWYDEAKFGIFMHWGLYSVPSVKSEWFWWQWRGQKNPDLVRFMRENYRPDFTYADFGPQFTAEFFDPDRFAKIVRNSGAKYVVLTSKHHEGYTMWPSNYSWNWNSKDVGPNRDIVGSLREAILNVSGVHFGLYFSQYEWFNPLYVRDKENSFETQEYVQMVSIPQMHEIVNTYKPDVLWSDGDWEASPAYWNSTQFLAWLYNSSPVKNSIVVNDRWGRGTACKHGGFFNCADKYSPGHLMKRKWESCTTVDQSSWGYRRTMKLEDIDTIQQLIAKLVKTISCGGNLLLNVGPTHDGRIVPIFEERLAQMGEWLAINGEAVYASKPWIYQNDTVAPDVWYTSKLRYLAGEGLLSTSLFNPQHTETTIVYAFVLKWPIGGTLKLGATRATSRTTVSMLGCADQIHSKPSAGGLQVELGTVPFDKLPSLWAWVLKLEYLASEHRDPIAELEAIENEI